MNLTWTAIGSVAVVGVVLGPLPVAYAGPLAGATVVSVNGGTLRISSPDVDSSIRVTDIPGNKIAVSDVLNPIVPVAPCAFDPQQGRCARPAR